MKQRPKKPIRSLRKKPILLGVLVLILLGVAGVYAYMKQQPTDKATTYPSASIPAGGHGKDTTTHAGPSHDTTPIPTATPTPVSNPDHPVSSTLAKPTQTLNTHSIHLSDASTMMDSTCSTVAGATCYIRATKGSTVITVSETKTDTGGGVELIWDAQKLSVGTWSIQAVADKSGSEGVSDSQSLEVMQ